MSETELGKPVFENRFINLVRKPRAESPSAERGRALSPSVERGAWSVNQVRKVPPNYREGGLVP